MFIYSCSARLISFEITLKQLISKEIRRAEREYMNIPPPPPPPPPPQLTLTQFPIDPDFKY